MGSSQNPTPEHVAELEKAGQLQLFTSPEWIKIVDGKATMKKALPGQGVSLLQFSW